MKIVVIGGASTYTPELIDGFARMHAVLPVSEVVLVDPQEERLELVAGVSDRIVASFGRPYQVRTEVNLVHAVQDADVVLIQLRVGGQAARARDERLPLGVGSIGQETTGSGGLAKAMRTVPVVLDVASVVAEHAPDAWIVDFTNPTGIITRALVEAGHRAVGLCNVAIGLQHFFADLAGVEPERVALSHVGLNHLSWETGVRVDGRELLPEMLRSHPREIAARVKLPVELVQHLGVVPSYYLRYYYLHDAELEVQRSRPSRAEEVAQIEQELLDLYADPSVVSKPEALARRGGALYSESAVQLMASLVGTRPGRHVVNSRNDGVLEFLPSDAVIEMPARVGSGRISLEPAPPVPTSIRGLIGDVFAYEELALDAALHGGRARVVTALLAHPLIGQWERAEKLADLLIAENRDFLPWA